MNQRLFIIIQKKYIQLNADIVIYLTMIIGQTFTFPLMILIIPEQKEVSLFCTKFGKLKYNFKKNINCFTFPEFSNYLLIGTKDEIISYICEEYNSLENDYNDLEKRIKNLDSANEIKEKSIKQMEKDLKKEKSEKEKIKNNLDNIEKEKNSLENNLQKEKSLTYKLNSKMEQLKKEKNNLKNEIQD